MAIQKEKTLANGATGNYWRIMTITIDRQDFKINGQLALFKDKATSDAGKPPLGGQKSFEFVLNMTEVSASPNVISYIYTKIQAHANAMMTHDAFGHLLQTPIVTDPDLSGGVMV